MVIDGIDVDVLSLKSIILSFGQLVNAFPGIVVTLLNLTYSRFPQPAKHESPIVPVSYAQLHDIKLLQSLNV